MRRQLRGFRLRPRSSQNYSRFCWLVVYNNCKVVNPQPLVSHVSMMFKFHMRKFLSLAPLTCVLLILGCSHTDRHFVKRSHVIQDLVLKTKGAPGQHFQAKLNVDGEERELSGVSPASFRLKANLLTGTIRKTHGDGTLRFEIREGGSILGFGALTRPEDSCRFRYHDNGIEVWSK